MQTPDGAEARPEYSYVTPIGYSNSKDCGYCRGTRGGQDAKRYSYYAYTAAMSPAAYQTLVDRCWRRSGTLLYRPNQRNACCPHYTIRLDAGSFKPSRDQRQAVNRFNKYVIGDEYVQAAARLYPRSREETRKRDAEFVLSDRLHEAETESLRTPPEPSHQFTVGLEPDTFTEEKYAVFENYQRVVHHEPPHKISRDGFRRFLCNSPLRRETVPNDDGSERKLGSYHQCYRLDGKLVAIGVLDLLPHAVSAVYFLYHESIHRFSPGKLGALREISLAAEGGYRWWYAGYYIHSCAKMRYKIDYAPQYVLDPESLDWDLLDRDALAVFDKKPYISLSRERQQPQSQDKANGAAPEAAAVPLQGTGPGVEPGAETGPSAASDDASEDDDDGEDEDDVALLESDMPGIPSLADMRSLDLGPVVLRSDYSENFFTAAELVVWDEEDISMHGSLKAKIAELVAAVGPDLMGSICVDFRRRRPA